MNDFTRAESKLVDKIVDWAKARPKIDENYKQSMIHHFACAWVRFYASHEDYDAAVDAVIALVGEKLNANP